MKRELLGEVNADSEIDDRLVQIDDEEFGLQIAEQKSSIKITEFITWLKEEQLESAGILQVLDWLPKGRQCMANSCDGAYWSSSSVN